MNLKHQKSPKISTIFRGPWPYLTQLTPLNDFFPQFSASMGFLAAVTTLVMEAVMDPSLLLKEIDHWTPSTKNGALDHLFNCLKNLNDGDRKILIGGWEKTTRLTCEVTLDLDRKRIYVKISSWPSGEHVKALIVIQSSFSYDSGAHFPVTCTFP